MVSDVLSLGFMFRFSSLQSDYLIFVRLNKN